MKPTFSIKVDRRIYSDAVISKAIYWHTSNFVIERIAEKDFETLVFQSKEKELICTDKEIVLQKFNQDLNDYKLRQVIAEETKDIRTILYVKAFANNDDFEEYE